jgi:hypothetical protein
MLSTVSNKYSLTVARHSAVVVGVPSTIHYPADYKIKNILFKLKFKSVNNLFTLIIYYKLLKVAYETLPYCNSPFCK